MSNALYFDKTFPVTEEGNYRVFLELGDPDRSSSTTVWTETRRLAFLEEKTLPGEYRKLEIIANVRNPRLLPLEPKAPGGREVILNERERGALHWDDKLSVAISGVAPALRSIRIEKVEGLPTIFLAGDSTVADQGDSSYASWGQMLPALFLPLVAVANHAESGETLKSFITGLRLAKILELARAGDYLFIQFGHNDQKAQWPQTYVEAKTTYPAYLRVFIEEARIRGLTPVLITSPERCNFDDRGRIISSLGTYPEAARELAVRENLILVDLERHSRSFYEALGPAVAPHAFAPEDTTHHSPYGAYELARCVALELARSSLPIASLLREGAVDYNPATPDPIEAFSPFIS